ncbi:hypothetical protein JCM16418A_11410 [Paenibacillus pini]
MVVDSAYVTIYCKNNEIVELFYLNAKYQGYINIEYITEENDMRTRLSVW